MIKSESLAKIAPALVAAQKEMGAALKDSKNPFFKSSYADLGAVIDASVPVLNKHDIAVLQTPTSKEQDGKAVVRTLLLHTSGEYIGSDTDIVCAKANDPQAYGSAVSYARRYGLQSTVTLKATDDDAETAMGRTTKTDTKNSLTVKGTSGTIAGTAAPGQGDLPVGNAVSSDTTKKKLSFAKKTPPTVITTTTNTGDDI